MFKNPVAQVLSSSISDHCPILVVPLSLPVITPKFSFESYWTAFPGYQDCVKEVWHKQVHAQHNPLTSLHIKLCRTTKALRKWSRNLVNHNKLANGYL
jgi:hypothetical protein